MTQPTHDSIRRQVSEAYTDAIKRRDPDAQEGCCGTTSTGCGPAAPTQGDLAATATDVKVAQANACCAGPSYTAADLADVDGAVAGASFGCGNPVAFAGVAEGEVVVDLGSGAGLDLLLAAERVGDSGRVIGVDMTDAMLDAARRNLDRSPVGHRVELRKGMIEALPVEDRSVDRVISNCVINLSPDKPAVFQEIARVLKPGGTMMVSDIVADGLPAWLVARTEIWPSCVAGAIPEADYVAGLEATGLTDVRVESRLVYDADQLRGLIGDQPELLGASLSAEQIDAAFEAAAGKVASVRFRATRGA